MGEQPLFVIKAHVFQLEPEFKKSWISLSTAAVNVQFFHDSIKNIYRILSVEGTKAIVNSVITQKMTFTKTSQKFGQWIDYKQNVVYGLGFANDVELNKFVDKFKEIKESARTAIRPLHSHERSNSCEVNVNRRENTIDMQLKSENDRLKLALAQSSTNARKWEEELKTLKNTNTRLTTALQESHSNVEEWKTQLKFYTEECTRLKKALETNDMNKRDNELHTKVNMKTNNTKLKDELFRLIDLFDQKFDELNEIREQFRELYNEFD